MVFEKVVDIDGWRRCGDMEPDEMVEIYERRGGSESTLECIKKNGQKRTGIKIFKCVLRIMVYLSRESIFC